MAITENCAKEIGFEGNQYIAVTHNDTGHQHIHIVINRVGYTGKTVRVKKVTDWQYGISGSWL